MFQGAHPTLPPIVQHVHDHPNMPLLCGPEVHTYINDKGIPRESLIPRNVTYALTLSARIATSVDMDRERGWRPLSTFTVLSHYIDIYNVS